MLNNFSQNTPGSRPNDGYNEFEQIISNNFEKLVSEGAPLFLTDAKNLWETYLNNLPEGKDHYTCNACNSFISRFGSLAMIDYNGKVVSALWNVKVPKFFEKSVQEMNKLVSSSQIKKMFVAEKRTLGMPRTGEWTHLHVIVPMKYVNKSRIYTEGQVMAQKVEDYKMLSNALNEFSIDVINQAVNLLNTETIYRGDKCLAIAKWFKEIKEIVMECNNSRQTKNFIWLAVANAPEGFCHIKSSMIGTLLEDIQSGLSYNFIVKRFKEKMDPSNYMRSQSAPTENAIYEAERLVAKLGIQDSLLRRYARLDEIPEHIWKPVDYVQKQQRPTGVFGNITPKNKINEPKINTELPTSVMTWEKFKRTILPDALSIEAKVENCNRLMAIVTALDDSSENILKWDNPFSWYYHGGIDAEIKERVERAGGKYENNKIRCSLIWDGYTDLDLHCYTPNGEHIYFGNKRASSGYLDIDMNGGSHRNPNPVENIRFSDNAPSGEYEFRVRNYCMRDSKPVPYKVELEINGEVYTYEGVSRRTDSVDTVAEFNFNNDRVENMSLRSSQLSGGLMGDWNINSGFQKVNLITTSPNLWGDNKFTGNGNHVFFILDQCKDLSEGKGRGFFNEMLKPELYQIRKTLEAYTKTTPIDGIENATACGLGFNDDNEWNVILRVKTKDSTRLIKIDRWD